MSRSNTPPRQPSGWPKPVAQAYEANEATQQRIGFPLGRPAAPQEMPTIYPQGTHPQSGGVGLSAAIERAQYPYPPAFEGQTDPRQQAPVAQQQGGYYPPPQPQHYANAGGRGPAPDPAGQRMPAHPYPGQGQQQWQQDPALDPHDYDQAGYPHPPGQGGGNWPQQDPYGGGDDLGYAAFGSQSTFDSGYGQPAGYAQQAGGDNLDGFAQEQAVYEIEEPRRRSGMLLVVGALVGAVAVGGGLAYGYKVLVGPDPSGPTPVVKGDTAPARLKPADAGGKQFPFADNKVYGRLSDNSPAASPAAAEPAAAPAEPSGEADTESSGTRKVTTFSVGRDGTIAPPQPSSEASEPASTVAVPGLTLDNGFPSRPPPRALAAAAESKAAPPVTTTSSLPEERTVVVPPPPAKPAVIAKAPPPAVEPEEQVAALPAPVEPAKKAAPPKRVVALPPPAPAAPAPAPAASDGANGFVAVVASVPVSASSRIDALKQFADLQQKYAAVLQDKTPDVREANLGEKGLYHRLLVGPPGSREQASAVCGNLKAAGYPSCWVTAF